MALEEKGKAKDPVTDADLETSLNDSRAVIPAVEEKKEELKVEITDVKKEIKEAKKELEKDDLTQPEKSALGRRLKRLEETQDQLLEGFNEIRDLLRKPSGKDAENNDGPPEYVSTVSDVLKIEDWVEEQGEAYAKDYMKVVSKLSRDNQDEHESIFKEMMENFNIKRGKRRDPKTWNPYADAEINYANAKASYLSKKYANLKPRPNLKGDKPPGGFTVETDDVRGAEKAIELDDTSKAFLKSIGKDNKWAREAMK